MRELKTAGAQKTQQELTHNYILRGDLVKLVYVIESDVVKYKKYQK
jgi:hypothetical protein